MDILRKDELIKKNSGDTVEGYVYIQSYTINPTKNGSHYISGRLQVVGDMPFKIWSNAPCYDKVSKGKYEDSICRIMGNIDVFGGVMSLIVNTVERVSEEDVRLKPVDFMKDVYDKSNYEKRLRKLLTRYCSENAVKVFDLIMTDGDVKNSFSVEYAATSHHDAVKSGLLAHTTKVVNILSILKLYTNIIDHCSTDLLYLSAALHDVGKVIEYNNGAISKMGKIASHQMYGVLMISKYEKEIVELMGTEFYYNLLAVIAQHHGEYGDRPRTVASYVINICDMLDAKLTDIDKAIADNKEQDIEKTSQIMIDGYKLL